MVKKISFITLLSELLSHGPCANTGSRGCSLCNSRNGLWKNFVKNCDLIHHCDKVGGPDCTAIGVSECSIKQASVELFLCLGCEGVIECEVNNLGPLGNLHWRLRPGAVTSIGNCAFVRGASKNAHIVKPRSKVTSLNQLQPPITTCESNIFVSQFSRNFVRISKSVCLLFTCLLDIFAQQ